MKVLSIFGTRPEAIKMAPLVRMLNDDPDIDSVLCVTAQHRQMLDQVLNLFELRPDYDLNLMKPGQTLSTITSGVLLGLDGVLAKEKPDLVLVHGDTSTSFVAALAAFYHQIPVGHVEAGLRTYDKYSPWPEEMNRTLTGRIADIHFAPTPRNRDNLLRENVPAEKIVLTGNTVIDALLTAADLPFSFAEAAAHPERYDDDPASLRELAALDFEKRRVICMTCHRRENLGENMEHIFSAVRDIVGEFDDVEVVYAVHMNPLVRETANKVLGGLDRVRLIEPLSYQPFINLMKRSYLIVTDSGGMQEEAPALGKPVLVVRKETERPEALESGTVRLAGVSRETIAGLMRELLTDRAAYDAMAHAKNPYGDGHASERIVRAIKEHFTK